ncbi:MAG: hypothetical protein U9N49_09250 [Campylobacterota bacterium]|nr:hypothetical protein [Campylobacterota bacterium]
MKRSINLLKNQFSLEMWIAVILFTIAALTNTIVEFIIYMLYFIIFLEITRAVTSFIREQRVKIFLLIDAFIILTLREFIVNVVKINNIEASTASSFFSNVVNFNVLMFSGVLLFLFLLRYLAKKTSDHTQVQEAGGH